MDSRLRTTREAAIKLKVKDTTLEQWRWNGKGPKFIKLGRLVRYRDTDLEDYLDECTYNSTNEAK